MTAAGAYPVHLEHGRSLKEQRAISGLRDELFEVLRASGHSQIGEVAAVVLETDGTFSVLADVQDWGEGALHDLPRMPTNG